MTDLFVLVVCAGLSGQHGCTVKDQAGYYSLAECEHAIQTMVISNPPRPTQVYSSKETDNWWTTFAYCRPGTPAEVKRWDKEGLGPK